MSSHPQRNLITRSIDGRADLDVDIVVELVQDGDRFLLCSDGLSGVLSDETLERTLATGTPEEAVEELTALALRAGGPDNITSIVADLAELGDAAAVRGEVAGAAGDVGVRSVAPAGAAAVSVDDTTTSPADPAPTPAAAPLDADDPRLRSQALRRRRTGLITAVVLVVLAVAALAGWSVVKKQYYVGTNADRVAVFKGVHGSVLGLDLSSVHSTSDVPVSALPDFEREQVNDGIHADGLADAEAIVDRLRQSVVAPTPSPSASPTLVPSPQ